jgi:hypothetical protein
MSAAERPNPSQPNPGLPGAELWEAGARALADGWRQSQDFWNSVARNWGEATGNWLGQFQTGRTEQGDALFRELQEAAFAVGQAWMRLPLVLASGARPTELEQAIQRLGEAQGRAYQMWMEALTRAGAPRAATRKPGDTGEKRS